MLYENSVENTKPLSPTISSTDFSFFGKKTSGKVRDIYDLGNKIVFITTDRLSAFDRNLALIPFKGQVLNQISIFWFKETQNIVPNHFLSSPDANTIIAKKLKVFPIEIIVRGYLSGATSTSIWTAYQKGERIFCGNALPEGMSKNQALPTPILTPTTKAVNEDKNITPEEIISEKKMSENQWKQVRQIALALFARGQQIAEKNGLILVDTKYEMGIDEIGKIHLCDEIHTPDSSRYWLKESYKEKTSLQQEPENMDKEFLRLWFKDNCNPYSDKTLPSAPDELILELSQRYIKLYEMIIGKTFVPQKNEVSRIEKNLRKMLI